VVNEIAAYVASNWTRFQLLSAIRTGANNIVYPLTIASSYGMLFLMEPVNRSPIYKLSVDMLTSLLESLANPALEV
jgi:hypothetical protein